MRRGAPRHPLALLAALLALAAIRPPPARAEPEEGVWVDGVGRAAGLEITPREARERAIQNARARAMESACGVFVREAASVWNSMLEYEFVSTESRARILETEILRWRVAPEPRPAAPDSFPAAIAYAVEARFRIACEEGEPDRGFHADVALDKSPADYRDGETMTITVHATRDCYVHVFSFGADRTIALLFPNRWDPGTNRLRAGETIRIPRPPHPGEEPSYRITIRAPPGKGPHDEQILLLATKDRIDLAGEIDPDRDATLLGRPLEAADRMNRWIHTIALDRRVEEKVGYRVFGGEIEELR